MKRSLLLMVSLLFTGIHFTKAQTLSPFDLIAPATNTVVEVAGSPTATISVQWSRSVFSGSSAPITYNWLLDMPGGNFSSPILTIPSNLNGSDSNLVMNNAQIEALMASLSLNVGDSADVIWTVRASAAGVNLLATQTFNIRLKRGVVNHPDLVAFSPIAIGGGSALGRAPATQNNYHRAAAVYPASDMSHFPVGVDLKSIGYTITTAASAAVSGNIKVYMVNTTDTAFSRSTTWATLISTPSPMKLVYDGPLTIPNTTGMYTITFDSAFTFTGGGIYVAFEWTNTGTVTTSATYQCNSVLASSNKSVLSNAAQGATLSSNSAFRPRIALGYDRPTNDLEVTQLYTLAKLPIPVGNPHTVQALVTNNSQTPAVGKKVYLNITGSNTLVDSQTVTLGVAQSTTVNFTGFNPSISGQNTVVVSVAADDNPGNNQRSQVQEVNSNTFSYADSSEMTNSVGYGATTAGIFANRYYVNGTAIITSMRARIGNNPATTGNRVYGVLLDSDNMLVGKSPNLIVDATDLGNYVTWTFDIPLVVTDDYFYVGMVQTPAFNGTGYFPLMFQDEAQFRSGAYYSTTDTLGGNLVPNTGGRRFILEALLTVDALSAFSLTAPSNNTSITLQGNQSQNLNFTWSPSTLPSGNPVQYTLLFDLPTGDFTNPVMSIQGSIANALSLTYGQIVDSLAARGITVGATFTGKWTVRASAGNETRLADAHHDVSFIVDIMTSVKEEELAGLKIYPNPSNGIVQIETKLTGNDEYELFVINTVGQQVLQKNITSSGNGLHQIDLTAFENGVYFVHLVSGNTNIVKRLVIQK